MQRRTQDMGRTGETASGGPADLVIKAASASETMKD
jgi:hypothetical protein